MGLNGSFGITLQIGGGDYLPFGVQSLHMAHISVTNNFSTEKALRVSLNLGEPIIATYDNVDCYVTLPSGGEVDIDLPVNFSRIAEVGVYPLAIWVYDVETGIYHKFPFTAIALVDAEFIGWEGKWPDESEFYELVTGGNYMSWTEQTLFTVRIYWHNLSTVPVNGYFRLTVVGDNVETLEPDVVQCGADVVCYSEYVIDITQFGWHPGYMLEGRVYVEACPTAGFSTISIVL